MRIVREQIEEFVALTSRDPAQNAERVQRARERLEADVTYAQRVHVALREGAVVASASAHPWLPDTWQAVIAFRDDGVEALEPLLTAWMEDVRALGGARLLCRLDAPTPAVAAMEATGWRRLGERLEFKTPVTALGPELDSPLRWRSWADLGIERAARVFFDAGQGPDWDDGDDAAELIRSYLDAGDMRFAIEIGFVDDEPAAFVTAQCEPATGWCTLTFMGLVRAFRGRGLGAAVHRHGFAMLRRLGGATYHGGTSAANTPMLRLFERHGCHPYLHLEEWEARVS